MGSIYELIISLGYRIKSNDKRFKYYRKLRKNLKLSREDIVKMQSKNIRDLIDHAYYETEYYYELFNSLNLKPEHIKKKEDLKLIPPLTKAIIRNNLEKLKSKDQHGKNLIRFTSGGSTGFQLVGYKSQYSEQFYRAVWLRNNSIAGWRPSDKSVWIWGSPIEHGNFKSNFLTRISFKLNRRIILNAYNYSSNDFPVWIDRIKRSKPKVIYGYSSIILEFSKYLLENKIRLPSIKIVVSTTEKLEKRSLIEEAFQCKVHDQYGCREIIAIGIESKKDEMLLTDDAVLLDINESNEFLLTALFSYGFPLINYKVGDIGVMKHGVRSFNSSENLPFPVMDLKIGRITDNFINSKNVKISTSALSTYMSTLDLGILEHQIKQLGYKFFIVNYVPMENTDRKRYEENIVFCLEEYFGKNLKVDFIEVKSISVEKSGKRLMFKREFLLEDKL